MDVFIALINCNSVLGVVVTATHEMWKASRKDGSDTKAQDTDSMAETSQRFYVRQGTAQTKGH